MQSAIRCPYFQKAFGWCVPIGSLAGLVGLGGGEFRLPVLMYVVGYPARTAVPLNLEVSLVTLTFALVVRSRAVSVTALVPYLNEVAGLAVGGVASAFYGARFVSAIKNEHLIKTIAALLGALGILILFEVAHPFQYAQVIPAGAAFHFAAGFALGIIVGLVSSILGVAGGELLIPTMMFIFGADTKTAGTASIVISVCVVTSGLWRYWRSGAIETRLGARRIVSAMSAGSLIGAALGGMAVGFAPVVAIKTILGFVLIAAAAKVAVSNH
ncbi:MAG: sulfite exporter TauE/SafE family protein [Xanthobacteraceae bacterium]